MPGLTKCLFCRGGTVEVEEVEERKPGYGVENHVVDEFLSMDIIAELLPQGSSGEAFRCKDERRDPPTACCHCVIDCRDLLETNSVTLDHLYNITISLPGTFASHNYCSYITPQKRGRIDRVHYSFW